MNGSKNKQKLENLLDSWAPNIKTAFLGFLSIRILSSLINTNIISECDEVMNYWEPTHYLLFGNGLQTWEYSPTYGIRSYAYVGLHALVGFIFTNIFGLSKIATFYGIRVFLGIISSVCETYFYSSILKRFGPQIGLYTYLFLLFSPGMFIASTAYLPSTFSMYCLTVAFASWYCGRHQLAVMSVACGTLLGWPFCVVMAAPLAIDILIKQGPVKVVWWGILSLLLFLVPSVLIDYHYYHKIVIPPVNIILYNVFTPHGPNIYGVEPLSYYFVNGFLNFNFVFFLALAAIPLGLLFYVTKKYSMGRIALYLSPMYIWIFLMLRMAHKEERFLFVTYPLICLSAGFGLYSFSAITKLTLGKISPRGVKIVLINQSVNYLTTLFCIIFIALSVSRIASNTLNYSAPFHVFNHLNEIEKNNQNEVNVCVGKEWYRFPSNFFLPSSHHKISFIKSAFDGQLPKPYSEGNGTWIIPTDFNDENKEEPSRYIDKSKCHYLIDLEVPEQTEDYITKDKDWEVVYQYPFLLSSRSHPLLRAFYVPFLSEKKNYFSNYYLFRNKRMK